MKELISCCVIIGLLFIDSKLNAQANPTIDNSQRLESVAEQNDQVTDFSQLEEQLSFYKENPIDLNNTNNEELQNFGLLNSLQIAGLLAHINKYGELIRLEELQSIDGFDLSFIAQILPYVKISGPLFDLRLHPKTLLAQGKQQLTLQWQRVLEKQNGYSDISTSASRYQGDPNHLKFKYRFVAGRYFSLGFNAEKDPGEQFFAGAQKSGFDFYSFHLFLRPGKFLKALSIGDYQVQFSQGLVAWSGMSFGKSSDVISIKKQGAGIKPYTSSNEFSFLRGFAFSVGNKNLTVDNWMSYRKLDANTTATDTLVNFYELNSIGVSGLHRNEYEIADRNKVHQEIIGTHLQWQKNAIKFELTYEFAHYSQSLLRGEATYQLHNWYGKDAMNYSAGYTWQFRNIEFFGESAFDREGNMATINGCLAALDPKVSISLMHRSFSPKYTSINANPFREGTKAQNEKGFYFGTQILASRVFKIAFYFDSFKFPWLRYQVDAPTNGAEWLGQITYSPARTTEIYLRIKRQNKPSDETLHEHRIDQQVATIKTNIRFNAHFKLSTSFVMLSRVEWVQLNTIDKQNGSLFLEEFQFHPMGKPISIILSYQMFNTDSYDTRIYAYEQDFPGSSSIPAAYYKGNSYYMMIRYHCNRNLDFWIRYGRTLYDNKTVIGSASEAVQGNHKSDVKVQMRYSF